MCTIKEMQPSHDNPALAFVEPPRAPNWRATPPVSIIILKIKTKVVIKRLALANFIPYGFFQENTMNMIATIICHAMQPVPPSKKQIAIIKDARRKKKVKSK